MSRKWFRIGSRAQGTHAVLDATRRPVAILRVPGIYVHEVEVKDGSSARGGTLSAEIVSTPALLAFDGGNVSYSEPIAFARGSRFSRQVWRKDSHRIVWTQHQPLGSEFIKIAITIDYSLQPAGRGDHTLLVALQ